MFAPAPPLPHRTPPRRALADTVHTIDVVRLSTQIGQGHQLLSPDLQCGAPLMQGSFSITRLREGLSLHCTDIVHLRDMATQFLMHEECVKVLLKLEGNAQVVVGRRSLPLDAGEGDRAVPHGAIVAVHAPETFKRHSRAGSRQRMVVLTLRPSWFDAAGISLDRFHEHLAVQSWQPSRRAVAIAEQLLHPVGFEGTMHRLHLESRSLELIAEAFSQTPADPLPASPSMPASASQRVRRLRELLDSGEADHLDMTAIARFMGCNASTLQQQFRAVCGQTIFDYLRQHRLQRAAMALQQQGASVAQAAEVAGYSSQANFSTAFRRHYGVPPKHYRNRL